MRGKKKIIMTTTIKSKRSSILDLISAKLNKLKPYANAECLKSGNEKELNIK